MTKKIKPFNIEEWKGGAKVETRDGRSVRILCTDMKSGYDIVGLAEQDGIEVVLTWLTNGRYLHPSLSDKDDDRDLVIVEEVDEHKRWAEIEYAEGKGYYINDDSEIESDEGKLNDKLNFRLFATEKQAKSALAMARISQLMAHDERYGGVVTDEEWKEAQAKDLRLYGVVKWDGKISDMNATELHLFLAFHTPEQRDLFIKENERLVKDYLMID